MSRLSALAPGNPKVQKLVAGIAEKEGRLQEAISNYESSFRGDSDDKTTIRYLGNILTNQELWQKSMALYREALEIHPNDPYFMERLGTLLIGCPDTTLRDINEGLVYSERAFIHMSSPPNTVVYSGRSLAFAYANLGRKQIALSTISETMNVARWANFSSSFQAELRDLYHSIEAL